MPKSSDPIRYTRPKAAELLGVSTFMLYHWERNFPQLQPHVSKGGHKYYTEADIALCREILHLRKDKGVSIKKVAETLQNRRICPPGCEYVCNTAKDALRLLGKVSARCEDAHVTARIDAVRKWIEKETDSRN